MSKLLQCSLLLSTLFTTLTTAANNPPGYCPGPVLPNNICCVNGVQTGAITGRLRCNSYGTTTFRSIPANPTSAIIPPEFAATNQNALAAAASYNNGAIRVITTLPTIANPSPQSTTSGRAASPASIKAQAPLPTASLLELDDRQYNTITYPDGYGTGTVAYPVGGSFSDPYGGGYGSYGPNGAYYNGPGVGYGNGVGVYGGGYGPYGGQLGITRTQTYITVGPNGPYTATAIYRAQATGKPGVRILGVGAGLVGGLFGLGLVG